MVTILIEKELEIFANCENCDFNYEIVKENVNNDDINILLEAHTCSKIVLDSREIKLISTIFSKLTEQQIDSLQPKLGIFGFSRLLRKIDDFIRDELYLEEIKEIDTKKDK